jgi:hypothetical protein
MLTRVRIDVAAATEKKQVPWVNSSLLGEVFLSREQRPTAARVCRRSDRHGRLGA